MNIYIMRHGTTVWNEIGRIQGHSNNRLSVNGKKLVQERAIEYKNTKFDVIFCSPLMRTVQTANLMNTYHNIKMIRDKRIIECDEGIYTRRYKSSLKSEEIENRKDAKFMESWQSVYDRSKIFIDYIKNLQYEDILIVTHDINATCLESILTNDNINFNEYKYIKNFNNAEVRLFNI